MTLQIPPNPTLADLERLARDKGYVLLALNPDGKSCGLLQRDATGNLMVAAVPNNGTPAFINVAATVTPTALPAKPGTQVAIKNMSGGNMTIGRVSGGTWTLPDGTERTFVIQSSSSELLVSVASGTYNVDAEVWG